MKILIVAHDVAPLDLISSQRINYFINYFSKKGYQVDVLTSKKRAIDGPITDIEKYNQLIKKANFIEIPSTISTGNSEVKTNISTEVNKKSGKREFLKKAKAVLTKITGQMLDYRTIWAFNSIKYIRSTNVQYDVLLTSSLPACVNWLGWCIKKQNTDILWISDFRDLWTLNHLVEYNFFSRSIDTFLEKKFLLDADLITTVSDDLALKMKNFHNKEVLVVRNGFVPEEYQHIQIKDNLFDDKTKVNIVYAGNIYKGRRDPSDLLKIIQKYKLENKVNIHFFGHYLANLTEIVDANNAESYCYFHKPLSRNEMFGVLKASDFNLFLESGESDAKGVMPGKIFELIALGQPIITIGPQDDFESVKLIKNAGLLIKLEEFPQKINSINDMENSIDPDFIKEIAGREGQVDKIYDYIEKMRKGI